MDINGFIELVLVPIGLWGSFVASVGKQSLILHS